MKFFITLLAALFCFLSDSKAQSTLDNGLIAYYPFTGNAGDSSGNSNHGTIDGAVLVRDRFGIDNSAYRFDGNNDYINLPSASFINPEYTYSLWVKVFKRNPTAGVLISIGGESGGDHTLYEHNSAGMAFSSYHNDTTGSTVFSGGVMPPLNKWIHVVGVRSDTVMSLYINGVMISSTPVNKPIGYGNLPTFAYLGARSNLSQFFNGLLDDVRIYNRPLSQNEISELYTTTKPNVDYDLVAYYPFSGGVGDSSGNSNHGTSIGAVLVQDRFGNPNSAYKFDGINDYINLPAGAFNNEEFTYSLWTNITQRNTEAGIFISIGGRTGGDHTLYEHNSVGMAFSSYHNDRTGSTVNSGGTQPPLNQWLHVVGVRSKSLMSLYINGVLISSTPVSLPIGYGYDPKIAYLGARSNLSQYFNGILDDVRIYNRPLNEEEIYELYTEDISKSKDGSNLITGVVYNDLNKNCKQDTGEKPLAGRLVKADQGPAYGFTDSNGVYKLYVNKGTFSVRAISPEWWRSSCNDSVKSIAFTADSSISFGNNFGSEVIPYQALKVDIATPLLRRCFRNTYRVTYCNEGTIAANNVQVNVEFPASIIPLSSNMEYVNKDSILSFSIGMLDAGECGSFIITDSVSCIVPLGSAHCVKASISSPSIPPNPGTGAWDKSSVKVEGKCVHGSIARFTITNTGENGEGDMDASSEYRIYANNELVNTGQFKLAGGASEIIEINAQGMTIRLEADQRPGHPGKSRPRETVEGCGTGENGQISFGFLTQVPEDDEDVFVEKDCQVIIGSFDPNDKSVKPAGLTENHYIRDDQELEYLIRFQNTGTDTAFTVVIRDTLSSALDVATLKSGASSHPYTLKVSGNGQAILEWTFPNILLPDSNINEPGSHGFVKYKIRQASNPKGTVIENRAGIIFDYNEPVITNYTRNIVHDTILIGDPIVPLAVKVASFNKNVKITIEPNPFSQSTRISVESNQSFNLLQLDVYDLSGKLVETLYSNTNAFTLQKHNLSNGIYIYRISSEGELLDTGKVIAD